MEPHDTSWYPSFWDATSDWTRTIVLVVGLVGFGREVVAQTADGPRSTIVCERLSTDERGGYGNIVSCFFQDSQGFIWFGTQAGVARYDGHVVKTYKHDLGSRSSIDDARVQTLWEDREGTLWVGTWRGLDRLDRATGIFSHFLPEPEAPAGDWGNIITDLCEDKRGTLWVGGKGLKSFDRLTGTFTSVRDPDSSRQRLFQYNAHGMYEDSFGDFWVGSAAALGKFDRTSGTYTLYWLDKKVTKGLPPDKWGFHWVKKIFEDRSGILWLCTNGGPVAFNRKRGIFKPYHIFPALPESSAARSVSSIVEDDAGGLWIGTLGGGLLKYNARSDRFESFSLDSITISSTIRALFKDRAGTIWIGAGSDGVLKILNVGRSSQKNTYVPPVVITTFKKRDVAMTLVDVPGKQTPIDLSYKDNTFTVEFAALNYIGSEHNQYAYMLDGYETQWNYCGTMRSAHYVDVHPGSYTFRVKGSNNDGVWNEEGASLAIIITPPWWRSTWFSAFLWVTAVGSAAGGVRWYERRKSRKKLSELEREQALAHERARISQDLHDQVGSALSEIAILSELAKKKPEQVQQRAQEISERTAELMDTVSEIVRAMNTKNDSLENLIGHGRNFVVKYLDEAGISCKFEAPDQVPIGALSADSRRNIALVVTEALHNVVKHSGASEVVFKTETTMERMKIRIQDNGKGFVEDERMDAGYGLENMKKRMEDIGGTIEIESQPGRGTTVVLVVGL